MEWSDLLPANSRADKSVVLSAHRDGARFSVVKLCLRPSAVPDASFLCVGAPVKLRWGRDGARQVLRIEPGGEFCLSRRGRRGALIGLFLSIPRPAWLHLAHDARTACEFDYSDSWIEIELPTWFHAPNAKPAAPVVPGAPAPKGPFVGALAGQPHPTAPVRR